MTMVAVLAAAAGLPLGDPQFWIVTIVTLAAVALLAWRLRRTAKAGPELPCASCPQAAAHRRTTTRVPLVAVDGRGRARSRS